MAHGIRQAHRYLYEQQKYYDISSNRRLVNSNLFDQNNEKQRENVSSTAVINVHQKCVSSVSIDCGN